MPIPVYEMQLHATMDKLSNNELVEIDPTWIEEAGENFKAALRKQLTPQDRPFILRMSNIGRAACQLQMEKSGAKKSRLPYNHITRMMLGDATECIMDVLLKAAKLPVTGGKNKVTLELAGTKINGEDDIELDGRIYDIKSCSPWAYDNKWQNYSDMKKSDGFGYVAQLAGYGVAQGKVPGGWIVMNKSTGEVRIMEVNMDADESTEALLGAAETIRKITTDAPFERMFKTVPETFYGKPTGNERTPQECKFCDFLTSCWPEAVYRPQTGSKAKSPQYYWYVKYQEKEEEASNEQ